MVTNKFKEYARKIDLRDETVAHWAILVCFLMLGCLSLLIRKSLIDFRDGDYPIFSGWYDFVKLNGLHSFKYAFSNYNPPYTYFLYVATRFPVSKIVALKGLIYIFDIFLAISVYFTVKIFRPERYIAIIAAIVTMFLPTVLFTGVLWGQFDDFYVAFILMSLYFGLKNNSQWAWACFGAAIAIKFQAIFFLPVLGVMSFKRIRWFDCVWGVGAFLALTLPPALVGRSLSSLLDIYPSQIHLFNGQLTLNAPNMYQWFPNSAFPYLDHAATYLTVAVVLIFIVVSVLYKKYSRKELLLASTLLLYAIPFLLPEMHERYFFPATIASLVLAFAYPRYSWVAVLGQVTTLLSYCPFLFGTAPVALSLLAIANLIIIFGLSAAYF